MEQKEEAKKEERSPGKTVTPAHSSRQPRYRRVMKGQAHIKCSYNNTVVTITDLGGAVLGWASAGSMGFKGAKKATPFAATLVSNKAIENVSRTGLKEVDVFIKGVGAGREAAVRALGNSGLRVSSIKDVTPIPHNGCRARKPRRV